MTLYPISLTNLLVCLRAVNNRSSSSVVMCDSNEWPHPSTACLRALSGREGEGGKCRVYCIATIIYQSKLNFDAKSKISSETLFFDMYGNNNFVPCNGLMKTTIALTNQNLGLYRNGSCKWVDIIHQLHVHPLNISTLLSLHSNCTHIIMTVR